MTRLAFLGTPEAAVPTLETLAADYDIAVVITRLDRPQGRHSEPLPTPVKIVADEIGIPVKQPSSSGQIAGILEEHAPLDLAVVVAFGMILLPDALAVPSHGLLNLHFSLLPRWRGAAPVARALMAGDTMTGVTIIRIDEHLDSGDVLTAQALDIRPDERSGGLTNRLAHIGSQLMIDSIEHYLAGAMVPVPQTDEGLTYAAKITPEDRPLSPQMTTAEFINRIRGLSPKPAATLDIDGQVHKVLQAQESDSIPAATRWETVGELPVVGVSDGGVTLLELQPPGKRLMSGESWLRGRLQVRGIVS